MRYERKVGSAIKRLILLMLIALVVLSMVGCDMLEPPSATEAPASEAAEADAEPTSSPIPTPTPLPTPEPSPVPVVEIADFKYQKLTNKTLDISFDYPSHWVNVPGNITICYVQPVNAGEVPARVAVSVKKISKSLDSAAVKKELEKLIDAISGSFVNFRRGSVSKKLKLVGSPAFSVVYDAELDGKAVKGVIIVAVKNARNRLVALHFYAPDDMYKDYDPVLKEVMGSLKLS